jgi:uncharacterized protein (DUF1697 family)
MTVQVALLRGINVGGNKKVDMAVLKQMFESMGFGRVRTYINSGNVVFESQGDADDLAGNIEKQFERTFGFTAAVITRNGEDFRRILDRNPFADEGDPSDLNLHIGFMSKVPTKEQEAKIEPYVNENDQFRVAGSEIYVTFKAGVRDSKLGNNIQKIGVPVTLRNWKTANKLAEMAAEMEN